MRELDVLLCRFLDTEYPAASEADKSAFETLLALSDPELVGYLLKGERAEDPDVERVLRRLRGDDRA